MDLKDYASDPRRKFVVSVMGQRVRRDICCMYLFAVDLITANDWHWLKYHFSQYRPHSVGLALASRCAKIEAKMPNEGVSFVSRIASLSNRQSDRMHYQQILQVLAEILVIERVLGLSWPENTSFFLEPAGRTGKRPELMVSTPDHQFLFEVKSPSLLDHQAKRASNGIQLPHRGLVPLEQIDELVSDQSVTLPRDTPVKDFLVSCEKKFSGFPTVPGANISVIVWDDYIYEPIGSLLGIRGGLLTLDTWNIDSSGDPVTYPSIDGIILIRHMTYFQRALAEDDLIDRHGLFDFGSATALPNVFIQNPNGREVPESIKTGLRAIDVEDKRLAHMAEYHVQDYVFWM
ncbi:hypothetical protein [Pseudooceanicola spongiae]|uniref:Uncharacterized protein n=1 Tax=Pseudooceanicola spongiae TaxID=2613965 RepID=A0A7L9WHF8_9RHOB|nr:hypothetical protein [Pseudooceanicola spongiae]QOL79679.1 hypothetical protein F3W81_01890 [Pseudooceanicola spongiae]